MADSSSNYISFAAAAEASGSDKFFQHGYQRFYPHHLDRFRDRNGNLVEIGMDEGKSLGLWRQYLPNAFLHGIDIRIESEGDRFLIHRCDQSDPEQLRVVAAQIQTAFAIVEDGSHIPEHQLLTWDLFFRTVLEPGGVYIVEDIEVSYWRRGALYGYPTRYGLHESRTFMAVMKLVVEWLNRDFLSAADRCVLANRLQDSGRSPATCEQVASIEFAQNCVVLRKREPWEQKYHGRPYQFADYI